MVHVNDPSCRSRRHRAIYNSNLGVVHIVSLFSISGRATRDHEWQCYQFLKFNKAFSFFANGDLVVFKNGWLRQGVVG